MVERGAVDLHEGGGGARAARVDGARDELLAGAALAGDEDGRARRRDALDNRQHALDRRARADEDQLAPVGRARGRGALFDAEPASIESRARSRARAGPPRSASRRSRRPPRASPRRPIRRRRAASSRQSRPPARRRARAGRRRASSTPGSRRSITSRSGRSSSTARRIARPSAALDTSNPSPSSNVASAKRVAPSALADERPRARRQSLRRDVQSQRRRRARGRRLAVGRPYVPSIHAHPCPPAGRRCTAHAGTLSAH